MKIISILYLLSTKLGVLSVGVHGSGAEKGVLASDILSIELILADCSRVTCSAYQNADLFSAVRCSLGALGIILRVTIQCVPLFSLEAVQYPLPFQNVVQDYKKIIAGAEYSRFWWFPHTSHCVVWQAKKSNRLDIPSPTVRQKLHEIRDKLISFYGLEFMYWVAHQEPSHRVIPYINRLLRRLLYNHSVAQFDLSYKVFSFENLFKHHVNEWSVPASALSEILERLKYIIEAKNIKAHFPIQITFTKGDDILMSPSYGEDRAYIAIVMYKPYGIEVTYRLYFEEFQRLMIQSGGRPHWGKFHEWQDPEFFHNSYPKYKDFRDVMKDVDPNRLFFNSFLSLVFPLQDERTTPNLEK
eukprot:TRINITY_DN5464_c0_g1_i2.p1 TRINITY_DN5464_c0_g1~~TRINITY_DN5464_c0_g1_i2.p1  ORF type:complete len:356 (-),score=51.73 TRINITY_DN5464_c0_g1_i2:36-1103(-)